MIRTISLALVASLALASTALANGSQNGHQNGNGHQKPREEGQPPIDVDSSSSAKAYSAAAALAEAQSLALAEGGKAVQGQAVQVNDSTSWDLPVYAPYSQAQGLCPYGGAGANWEKFAVNLGQSAHPACMRLYYKQSLLAESQLLGDVARLLSRRPTTRDPKGPTTDKVEASIAASLATALLEKNKRIEQQNDKIEAELDGGWGEYLFGWMRSVPVLKQF